MFLSHFLYSAWHCKSELFEYLDQLPFFFFCMRAFYFLCMKRSEIHLPSSAANWRFTCERLSPLSSAYSPQIHLIIFTLAQPLQV